MKHLFPSLVLMAIGLALSFHCSSDGSSGGLTTVSSNLTAVSSGFTPESLEFSSSSNSQVFASSDNPCEGTDGLFDCQPNLLKLYYSMSKSFFDLTRTIVSGIATEFDALENGTGSFTTEDDENEGESLTIEYVKSDTQLTLLVKDSSNTPQAYVSISDNAYTLRLSAAAMDDDEDVSFEASVNYTDENTWSVTTFFAGATCESDDVEAPERIKLVINKADGVWKGKAMMYHPRWLPFGVEHTCSDAVSDSSALNLYTDFVGNDTATKAKLYFFKRTEGSSALGVDAIDGFGCTATSYAELSACTSTTFDNPFCVYADGSETTWGDGCSSVTTISDTTYGTSSDWVIPSEFYTQAIEIPTSL